MSPQTLPLYCRHRPQCPQRLPLPQSTGVGSRQASIQVDASRLDRRAV